MKNRIPTIIVSSVISLLTLNVFSQISPDDISKLNTLLQSSLYKTVVEINDQNDLSREDNNGNTFEYNLKDISTVSCLGDGFYNVMKPLSC